MILPLNPGVGQNVAMLVSPTVSSSFLTCTFPTHTALQLAIKSLFFPWVIWTWLTQVPVWALHSKIGHPSPIYYHKHFTQQECKQASKLQLVKDIDRQSCVVCITADCERLQFEVYAPWGTYLKMFQL